MATTVPERRVLEARVAPMASAAEDGRRVEMATTAPERLVQEARVAPMASAHRGHHEGKVRLALHVEKRRVARTAVMGLRVRRESMAGRDRSGETAHPALPAETAPSARTEGRVDRAGQRAALKLGAVGSTVQIARDAMARSGRLVAKAPGRVRRAATTTGVAVMAVDRGSTGIVVRDATLHRHPSASCRSHGVASLAAVRSRLIDPTKKRATPAARNLVRPSRDRRRRTCGSASTSDRSARSKVPKSGVERDASVRSLLTSPRQFERPPIRPPRIVARCS
jgi:hypothetical protein